MSIPIFSGDDEEPFRYLGLPETVLLFVVLLVPTIFIELLTVLTSPFVRLAQNCDFAGPYRRVR